MPVTMQPPGVRPAVTLKPAVDPVADGLRRHESARRAKLIEKYTAMLDSGIDAADPAELAELLKALGFTLPQARQHAAARRDAGTYRQQIEQHTPGLAPLEAERDAAWATFKAAEKQLPILQQTYNTARAYADAHRQRITGAADKLKRLSATHGEIL